MRFAKDQESPEARLPRVGGFYEAVSITCEQLSIVIMEQRLVLRGWSMLSSSRMRVIKIGGTLADPVTATRKEEMSNFLS